MSLSRPHPCSPHPGLSSQTRAHKGRAHRLHPLHGNPRSLRHQHRLHCRLGLPSLHHGPARDLPPPHGPSPSRMATPTPPCPTSRLRQPHLPDAHPSTAVTTPAHPHGDVFAASQEPRVKGPVGEPVHEPSKGGCTRSAAQGPAPWHGGQAGSTRTSGLGGPGLGRVLYLVESQHPNGRSKKPSLTGVSEDSLRVRMKAVRCPPGACRAGTDTGLARPLLWGFHCPRRYRVLGGGDPLRSPGPPLPGPPRKHTRACMCTHTTS